MKKVNFGEPSVPRGGYTWLNDKEYLRVKDARTPQGPGFAIVRVDALTGAETPLFDQARLITALSAVPGLSTDDAARLGRQRAYPMNATRTALVVDAGNDLFLWQLGSERVVRLTSSPSAEEEVTFSPDGRLVAFVRAHNLYVVDLDGRERQLTVDGHAQRLNGKLDWVYQEERSTGAARTAPTGAARTRRGCLPAARRSAGPGVHRRRSHPVPAGR